MSVIRTQVIAEAVQRDGRRRYRCRFHTSEGDVYEHDFNLTPVGFDIDQAVIDKTPEIEELLKQEELDNVERKLLSGRSLSEVRAEVKYNNNADITSDLFTKMRSKLRLLDRSKLSEDVEYLFFMEDVFENTTNSEIAAALSVSVSTAMVWRASFLTLLDSIKAYPENVSFLKSSGR